MSLRPHSRPWRAVRGGCEPHARGGFTLFEIMLVVVILGVASAMAMPYFVRSLQGVRLRLGTRLVLSSHRQAQIQAILKQQQVALLFDTRKGTIETVSMTITDEDPFFGNSAPAGSGGGLSLGGLHLSSGLNTSRSGIQVQAAAPVEEVREEHLRRLEESVRFSNFRGGYHVDGIYYVLYYPNGMCSAYEVTVEDEDGRRNTVMVDAITGKAKVRS